MTMEDERNLDLMVAELEQENRLMRARNERLERELNEALDANARFKVALGRNANARFKVALERIIAISQLAFRDGRPQGTGEVGPQEHDDNAKTNSTTYPKHHFERNTMSKQAMHLYQEQQAVEMNQETATHTEQRVVIRDFTPSEKADDRQVGGDHYKNMGVEPWNVVDTWPREQRIGYYRGAALKYLMRMGSKDQSAEEIGKGLHYMQKLLEVLNEVDNSTTEGYAAADMASAAAQGFRDGYASAKRGE